MRVYKPSYTKPLPEGGKILKRFTRKGNRFAKYKDRKDHIREGRLSKQGDKLLCETSHWHIEFDDNQKIRRHLKAYTNEKATQRLADKIQDLLNCKANNTPLDTELQKFIEQLPLKIRDQLISFGLVDAQRTAATKTLYEFVGDFEKSLKAKERSPKYISETVSMLKCMFDSCEFRYWMDISPTKVENYLKDLRDNGISYRRSNGYLTAIKSFCSWMVRSYYASESPVRHLTKLDVELDRRRIRRAATPDESRRLLETTIKAPRRYGMSGYERYLLYRFTFETGLRANEIRTLTVGAFDFDNLTVEIDAAYSKHRRKDVQPLKPDLAAELKEFFKGKTPKVKAFGGTYKRLTDKTAPMIRADLADAGIPYKDDNGRVLDFHAERHTFITDLRTVPTSVRQSLARHQSSAMTDRYTHVNLHDERAALATLPDLTSGSEQQQVVKTGTDGNFLPISCFEDEHTRTVANNNEQPTAMGKQKQGFERAREDSNLQPSDSKSATLSN